MKEKKKFGQCISSFCEMKNELHIVMVSMERNTHKGLQLTGLPTKGARQKKLHPKRTRPDALQAFLYTYINIYVFETRKV